MKLLKLRLVSYDWRARFDIVKKTCLASAFPGTDAVFRSQPQLPVCGSAAPASTLIRSDTVSRTADMISCSR